MGDRVGHALRQLLTGDLSRDERRGDRFEITIALDPGTVVDVELTVRRDTAEGTINSTGAGGTYSRGTVDLEIRDE